MALTYDDWNEISGRIAAAIAQAGESFIQGEVVKRDTDNRLIWLKELGDTPIPVVAFDYYFIDPVTELEVTVKLEIPFVGDLAVIALHLGSRRLPRCIGKIQSTGWVDG